MKVDKRITSNKKYWSFKNNRVSKNFDSHVRKSVPFYDISHEITVNLSNFFSKKKSICYDIGCSTGTLLKKIKSKNIGKKVKLIGIDESKSMLKIAKKNKNIIF